MKNKILLKGLHLGIKKGWNAPMLPKYIENINNNPLIRIFRVLGGISIVTVLTKSHFYLGFPISYIILIFALMHFMYITIISFIKLYYGIIIFKSDKLDIRNSPLDRFATTAGKLLYCWKYGCQAGSAGLGLVGTSFMIDSILEAGNQEIEKIKNMEKGKLVENAAHLAKKIKEHSNEKN